MNDKDKQDIKRFQEQDLTNKAEFISYHATKSKLWTTEDNSILDTVCAKMVKYPSGSILYFVKREGCSFFDPTHVSSLYKKKFWKIGPVSKLAFDLYLEFLGFGDSKSKGHIYYKLKAERLV
jgi:hypothetical protein